MAPLRLFFTILVALFAVMASSFPTVNNTTIPNLMEMGTALNREAQSTRFGLRAAPRWVQAQTTVNVSVALGIRQFIGALPFQ
ncbi:hypothetical protein BDW59DRAFT_155892 [Aspergillus cavernicola]|uniref:Secreted protein n=1 Tax=Aspergillus cavernicola TaxID=176166 RepID=A0ABR4J507_9EURO